MDEQLKSSLQQQILAMRQAVQELGGKVTAPSRGAEEKARIGRFVAEAEKIHGVLRSAKKTGAIVSYETVKLVARWNDTLFGVTYCGKLIDENKSLTAHQCAILNSAIEEIDVFAEREELSPSL